MVNHQAGDPTSSGAGMPIWLRTMDRSLVVIERVFGAIAVLSLVLLILNTSINALVRNLWTVQIPGSQNITILYFLPAVVFLGLTVVQANDSHIAATLFVERLGRNGQRVCKIVANALIAFTCFLMSTGALSGLVYAWGSSLGGSPDLPVGPSWLFVPAGFAIVMLRAIQQVIFHSLYTAEVKGTTEASRSAKGMGDGNA